MTAVGVIPASRAAVMPVRESSNATACDGGQAQLFKSGEISLGVRLGCLDILECYDPVQFCEQIGLSEGRNDDVAARGGHNHKTFALTS